MKYLDTLHKLLLNPIVSYLIVIGVVFVGVQINQCMNDVFYMRTRIEEISQKETHTQPVDIFFKHTSYDVDKVNIIDRSFSLDSIHSLSSLDYDLHKQAINTKLRLIVYVGDTNDISFEQETADIVRRAQSAETSLLAINFSTGTSSLTISPQAGAYFTDQEVKKLLDTTINPALRDNKLEFAIKSTIEKFQLEITGANFYTASDLRSAQLVTAMRGAAKADYAVSLSYYTQHLSSAETYIIIYVVGLIILVCLGVYHMWRTSDKVYGFLFGMSIGYMGSIVSTGIINNGRYVSYEQSMIPIVIFTIVGGLVGLFVDYILSVPKRKRVRASASPSRRRSTKQARRT